MQPQRSHCAGCRYEVRTKASLEYFASECKRILHELEDNKVMSIPHEYKRREYTLYNTILPIIAEIYALSKRYTSTDERLEYAGIIREVLGVGNNSDSKKESVQL